ncbi:MAG: hypothetical protein KJ737_07315 [Proteobacteria bacterium]|nr:hypothetical protein [Pseudomonadota bacterium]
MRREKFPDTFIMLIVFSMLFIIPSNFESAMEVLIIANNSVHTDSLSKEEIKNIFTGVMSKWPDQKNIHFATLLPNVSNVDLHEAFTRKYIKKTSGQFEIFWRYQLFTGNRRMPPMCKDEQKMIEFVETTDGAIGYVSASASIQNVKIITVSDK